MWRPAPARWGSLLSIGCWSNTAMWQSGRSRKALIERGDNEFGPYQSPMEDGMQKFHEWYRAEMGAVIP